ncbi:hypothetical protein [Embleya sp. NPDC005971]|uniref:hypothetical protein n=1 Tax=unclassified Embleya TaxID=2699296 RepID=UPI0033EE4D4A
MIDELPDPRTFLAEVDWARLRHGGGMASSNTPVKLGGLVSGNSAEVAAGLDHLWDDLFHQGSVYPATAHAAVYVAAILGDAEIRELLVPAQGEEKFPLRGRLLNWLAELAYAVSREAEMKIRARFDDSMLNFEPIFGGVWAVRPILFQGVSPYFSDMNPDVRESALLAAVHLLDAPELVLHRSKLAPLVRTVLAASTDRGHRSAAIAGLEAWGEDVDSLRSAAELSEEDGDSWNSFWNADRGSLDEPPF